MQATTITSREARKQFGKLLELAFYKGNQYKIVRHNKPIGWIVGQPFMEAIVNMMKTNPSLRETIEILLDEKAMKAIAQAEREIKDGKLISFDKVFDDEK